MRKNAKLPRVLGKKIQRLRKKASLTQEELAKKIRISTTYMGFIEQGRYSPSLKIIEKIAKILRMRVGDLFP